MTRPIRELMAIYNGPVDPLLQEAGIDYEVKPGSDWHNMRNCPWCNHKGDGYECGVSETYDSSTDRYYHNVYCWHDEHNGGERNPHYADFLVRLGKFGLAEADAVKAFLENPRGYNGVRPSTNISSSAMPAPSASKVPTVSAIATTPEPAESLEPTLQPDVSLQHAPKLKDGRDVKLLSAVYARNQQRRLFFSDKTKDPALAEAGAGARAWLTGDSRGLSLETLDRFLCGLSEPYTPKTRDGNQVTQNYAWTVPVLRGDGRHYAKQIYYNVPGVTQHPQNANSWCAGKPCTFYSDAIGSRKILVVCEGIKDIMRTWQAIQGTRLAATILLVTSTNGKIIPEEWHLPAFWAPFDQIFAAQDADKDGDEMATTVARLAGKEVRRLRIPLDYGRAPKPSKDKKADLTDFWQNGGTLDVFKQLMRNAPIMFDKVETADAALNTLLLKNGQYGYRPVDIHCAYVHGHLYYTTEVLDVHTVTVEEGSGGNRELKSTTGYGRRTFVIRSDRTSWLVERPPVDSRQNLRPVLRLSDGTLITREPVPSVYNTWNFDGEFGLYAYLQGTSKARPLGEILDDVITHLRSAVWLPNDSDYTVLALAVPVTFTQEAFDAVPLFQLHGPRGTGKTQTGLAMHRICCNSYLIGQVSAASAARLVDQTRGFVVLDDQERVKTKDGFSEFEQLLKMSYNKETANKVWTDPKTFEQKRLNFYGVKLINNTAGVDPILASRMFRVQTRKMPEAVIKEFHARLRLQLKELENLRGELHTWAFENVRVVEQTYKRLFPDKTDRADEINAPLQVMAELAGDPKWKKALDEAAARQRRLSSDPESPEQVLDQALADLVASGYRTLSTSHVLMAMKASINKNYGKEFANELANWERPEWVNVQLGDRLRRDLSFRRRLWPSTGPNVTFYPLDDAYVKEVLARTPPADALPERDPGDFCGGCEDCPFAAFDCEFAKRRQAWESTEAGRKWKQQQNQKKMEAERMMRDAVNRYRSVKDGDEY